MSWSLKLLRIKGIDIKVHLTFVLILVWAAYRWSGSTGAGIQGAIFGIVATLLLFFSVTLHELGHSFQALKFGVRVRDITLLPMGGMARMEAIPEKPSQELRIALAGPLVNFVIAAVLIGVGALLQVRSVISVGELFQSVGQVNWAGMLAYLTTANLFLGLFNLIPAFPMDGGRVLRALLAMKMDYSRATAAAVAVGQGLAWLLGIWGAVTGSYTLVLIAIFVYLAAGQEGQQQNVKGVLGDTTVGQVMTRRPYLLTASDTLEQAADLTLSTAQSDFPVVRTEDSTLMGVLTEAGLIKGLKAEGGRAQAYRFAHKQPPVASPEEPLVAAHRRMSENRQRAMPVVDPEGRILGLLTTSDINEAYRLLSTGLKPAPYAQPVEWETEWMANHVSETQVMGIDP